MLYFSEIHNEKIFTENKHPIGNLKDFLFIPADTPLITKFVIRSTDKKTLIIPSEYCRKNGYGFILKNNYVATKVADSETSIMHHLQNQQIIDIKGSKLIRVNDVVINESPSYVISGIDVGILGVFRWIHLARIIADLLRKFSIQYKSSFIPWSEIQPKDIAKGRIVLKKDLEQLKKIHPEDLAERLENSTIHNVLKALKVMDSKLSARVVADMNLDYQKELFKRFSPERAGKILSLIDPDEAVDALLLIDETKRQAILPYVDKKQKKEIEYLIKHAKTPIGQVMTTEWHAINADMTIRTVVDSIKKETSDFSELVYVYGVNRENQIVGALDLHMLLLQKPEIPFYKVMNQNLVLGRLTTPKEILLRRMLKYNLNSIPIVDEKRTIIGIVILHDIAEDLLKRK